MSKMTATKPHRPLNSFFVHFKCVKDDCDFEVVCTKKRADKILDAHTIGSDCGSADFSEDHSTFCPCCGHFMHGSDHCPMCFCEIHESHCSMEALDELTLEDCITCDRRRCQLDYATQARKHL